MDWKNKCMGAGVVVDAVQVPEVESAVPEVGPRLKWDPSEDSLNTAGGTSIETAFYITLIGI